MLLRSVFTAILVLCGLYVAIGAELPIRKGQKFDSARAALVHAGWKPIETFKPMDDGELEHFHFGAGEIYRAGFKEVESCMGTGTNPCFYNYHKGNRCLFLIADGEYDAKDPGWAKVTLWYLYPVPNKSVSNSRPQFPFCSEAAANRMRPHIFRTY